MYKKITYLTVILLFSLLFISGCNEQNKSITTNKTNIEENNDNKNETLNIITTMFPTYDFARSIVGDKGNVTMLLPVGTECHSYEPTPKDIININSSDLLIYTGKYMETWVNVILDSLDNKNLSILDVSEGIELLSSSNPSKSLSISPNSKSIKVSSFSVKNYNK